MKYKVISVTGKPVYEHRYIMEQHLKRKLKSSEIVHHVNHIGTDNRIDNLQILTKSEHHSHHILTTIRTPTHKTCSQCRQLLPYSKFSKNSRNLDGRRSNCKTCQNIYNVYRRCIWAWAVRDQINHK